MSFQYSCSCGRRLQVADDLAGKPVRCPACFLVAEAAAKPAEPEPPMAELVAEASPVKVAPPRTSPLPSVQPIRVSGWANAAILISALAVPAGLFTLRFARVWIPGGILGLAAGIVALSRISNSGGELGGTGRARVAIVLGAFLITGSIALIALLDVAKEPIQSLVDLFREVDKFTHRSGNVH